MTPQEHEAAADEPDTSRHLFDLTDGMTPSERAFMYVVCEVKPGGRLALLGTKAAAILLAYRASIAADRAEAVTAALDEVMLQRSGGPWLRWYVDSKVAEAVRVARLAEIDALIRHRYENQPGLTDSYLSERLKALGASVGEGDATAKLVKEK